MRKYLFLLLIVVAIVYLSGNIFIGKLCVAAVFSLCVYYGLKEKSFVNPYFLFSVAPLSLLVYFNLGNFYMVDITSKTIVLGLINMMAFLFALYETKPFSHTSNCIGIRSKSSLMFASVLLYLISLLGNFFASLASVMWIFAIPAIVCALKTKKKIMFLFVIFIFLISALGVTSKSAMLTYCLTFLICYDKYYAITAKQKKKVMVASILCIIFMVFAFSFANKGRDSDANTTDYYINNGVEWNFSSQYFLPYMYLTNGWTNLQYITETQDTRTYGLWLVRPILGYLGLKDNFQDQYHLEAYSSFNTTTFIAVAFKDFGYWLSVIMSLILGYFVKKIYSRFVMSRSPFDVACYVLVGLSTLEMFFSNHFFMQSYPFTAVIIMEISKRLVVNDRVIEVESI